MAVLFRFCAGITFLATWASAQQIVNGQIYTPGIAIVDAPQPNTPLGGDYLQVALDVTSDGQLQLPPYPQNNPSQIYNITIFLSSYVTGKNFTISNGTATEGSLGEIMSQESGSTVKHVNWFWPDCLVGDGDNGADRGLYNISIRQNFRLNNTDMYTIFDLPIQVTNSIPSNSSNGTRHPCLDLNNPLWNQTALNQSANSFTRIIGSAIQTDKSKGQGLGGAGILNWRTSVHSIWLLALVFFVAL